MLRDDREEALQNKEQFSPFSIWVLQIKVSTIVRKQTKRVDVL